MRYLLPLLLLAGCVWDLNYADVPCSSDNNCPQDWHCSGTTCEEGDSPDRLSEGDDDDDAAGPADPCCPGGSTGTLVVCDDQGAYACAVTTLFGCGNNWSSDCADLYGDDCGATCE